MLKLDNICLSFDGQQVIKNFCLELKAGERIALMGPSGGGKTSLLRIIAGLLKPDSGEIHNDFHQLSFMFQEPRLLPWLKAWENVNLLLSDNDSTKAHALELLCHFDLCEDGEKYPHELSGGMQQRVALARALAVDADLFLMDEPFKAMDEKLRFDSIERSSRLVGNAAVLLVTHDIEEAEAMGCRIINIKNI